MARKWTLPPWNFLAVLHDCVAAAASFALALYLRLGDRTLAYTGQHLLAYSALFMLVLLGTLLYSRTYRRVWRYTSINDLLAIMRAGTFALIFFYGALFLAMRLEIVPRSVPFIHWMTLMLCLLSGRLLVRMLVDQGARNRLLGRTTRRTPVLLIGVTAQAEMFIRESERSADFPYVTVGLISDNPRDHGREVHGVRVYGSVHELGYILKKLERKGRAPQRVLLTDPSAARNEFDSILKLAEAHHIALARLPSLSELKAGEAVENIQPVVVDDILGRRQAVLDRDAMGAFVQGRKVVVTGAGGSIGSELVRQIAQLGPSEIMLYELSEFLLYEIDRELRGAFPHIPRRAVIGDVRDAAQLERQFASFAPDLVFHAAAIKHVPLSETNPEQAVLTNVLGTKQVADACVAHGVTAMVQVSTDKAVNPTSLMGATKRVAEIYCQTLAQQKVATRFVTVRFGNVLNSAGSVVPLFQQQIARGGPVTVTHRDMTRYFMTIAEATQLILQAAVLAAEQPSDAPIFVLDMGEPIRIEDLACQMIRLTGRVPYTDIAIEYTGLRPGEKLYEELFHEQENLLGTRHQSIRLAQARSMNAQELMQAIALLLEAARAGRSAQLPMLVKNIVAEYHLPDMKASHA